MEGRLCPEWRQRRLIDNRDFIAAEHWVMADREPDLFAGTGTGVRLIGTLRTDEFQVARLFRNSSHDSQSFVFIVFSF
jgi:hypothetical protein